MTVSLYPKVQDYCTNLSASFSLIPEERKSQLLKLSQYFLNKYQQGITPQAIVICTHNSRRSHLGQLWLAIGADHYQLPTLNSYSGGTEATALNPRVASALVRVGLNVSTAQAKAENPVYEISWIADMQPYQAFSKKFEHPANPQDKFAAIMVCNEADQGCPFVPGTDFRLSLPYDDPKAFDETPLESQKYDERCEQIGREMLFVLSELKKQWNVNG